MSSVTNLFGSLPATQRLSNLDKANVPFEPFIGNDYIRQTYYAFTIIIFLLGLIGVVCGFGVIGNLFFYNNPNIVAEHLGASTFDDDGAADTKYKDMRATLIASLTCCSIVGILVLIMIILYFFFLEQDLLFSERMSINLATMTQGPDRAHRAAGLLSTLVYPQGATGEDDTARNNLANDILQNLRKAYYKYNDIEPSNDEYQQLVRNVGISRTQAQTNFINPSGMATPAEIAIIREQAMRLYPNEIPRQQTYIREQLGFYEGRTEPTVAERDVFGEEAERLHPITVADYAAKRLAYVNRFNNPNLLSRNGLTGNGFIAPMTEEERTNMFYGTAIGNAALNPRVVEEARVAEEATTAAATATTAATTAETAATAERDRNIAEARRLAAIYNPLAVNIPLQQRQHSINMTNLDLSQGQYRTAIAGGRIHPDVNVRMNNDIAVRNATAQASEAQLDQQQRQFKDTGDRYNTIFNNLTPEQRGVAALNPLPEMNMPGAIAAADYTNPPAFDPATGYLPAGAPPPAFRGGGGAPRPPPPLPRRP